MTKHIEDRSTAVLPSEGGGCTEIAFTGKTGAKVLTVTHRPEGEPVAGLVIASSIHSEFLKNNRREVLISRRLADMGVLVRRFQFRGTGNSDDADLGIESMTADLRLMLGEIRSEGVEKIGFVATRLAALPLALVMQDAPGAPVALIEPIVSGRRFFRDLLRSLLMRNVATGGSNVTSADLVEGWERSGALDVLGFSLDLNLYLSMSELSFATDLGVQPRQVALVQMSRSNSELRSEYAKIAEAWMGAGHTVEFVLLPYEEAWWFHQDASLPMAEQTARFNSAVVDSVCDWYGMVWGLA